MSASAEEEVVPAPPQPQSPLPDEPFFAPAIVDGIDGDVIQTPAPPQKADNVSDIFSTLSARMSDAVRVSRTAVTSVLPMNKSTIPGVLFFGDSITEFSVKAAAEEGPGWGVWLQEVYAGKVDLFVRGFSGYNTRWACHILPRVLEQCSGKGAVRVVVIFFGSNDATIDSERQHVPLEEYTNNLRSMVEFVRRYRRANPIQTVLVSPPPLQESGEKGLPERLSARTQEYAEACMIVAKEMDCPMVDLYAEMTGRLQAEVETEEEVQKGLDRYLCDGLHLNTEGNQVVAELMLDMFRKDFPSLCPDVVKRPFPPYKDIDPNNLAASLGENMLV